MSRSPLQLPTVTAGFAAVTLEARTTGERASEAAAVALSATLGETVRLVATPRPIAFTPAIGAARLGLALCALPACGVLEVDARFAASVVDVLAGGSGRVTGGVALTPIESAALELLALVALDGAASVPEIGALAPRLVREAGPDDVAALAVDLAIEIGALRGMARLVVPAAVVARLGGTVLEQRQLSAAAASWRVPASLRSGTTTLRADELAALAPGDVVLLDESTREDLLYVPGGRVLAGHRDGDLFSFEESRMTPWTATFPVALAVEIARVELTLGDIARLEPGGVLPLHVSREGFVTLRAGERAVARGQLVDVDGALGVRIEALEVCS